MGQQFRTDAGGLIDRSRPLSFKFDGTTYQGYAGDTLASALLANGVRLVGRSFKYHRPRGILSAGGEEPNALVELRSGGRQEPNTRATVVELYDGLVANSQNRWPSLKYDVMSVNQLASPFLGAGFYYKTFKWPASFWEPVYERVIRRAAGLGSAASQEDPDHYEKAHASCDLLVIGAGPAGLMSALTAGRAGARVILADDRARFGGALLSERVGIGGDDGASWSDTAIAELESLPNVRMFSRTTVFGRYDAGTYGLLERIGDHLPESAPHTARQCLWRIYTKQAILASGAIERPIVFGDNDRPGVMMAGAARTYANQYGVRAGDNVVVFGNSDDVARTVADLGHAGVTVAAVVDTRKSAGHEDLGRPIYQNSVVRRALGGQSVQGVEIGDVEGSTTTKTIDCDGVIVSGGWSPNIFVATHLGQKPSYDAEIVGFTMPDELGELRIAGAASGIYNTSECLKAGENVAVASLYALGLKPVSNGKLPNVDEGPSGRIEAFFFVSKTKGKCFVDFQNDVTDKDLKLAVREGYDSAEHAKRYTTFGMATDQGKTGSLNGAAILADAIGASISDVGVTTARPPYTPVSFGAWAGHSAGEEFQPVRLTPMHRWHEDNGAIFVEAGLWYRPSFYRREGEKTWLESSDREVLATRNSVGISDVSTLGKIDVQGPDAGAFLNKLYVNGWTKLPVGKARYGLMLREDGMVMDDGTTSRLDDEHYLMTTTTANAGPVMAHMDYYHQVVWPELDVQFVSVTEQWAQMAVAGPRARDVLKKIVDGFDLSNAAFPFMGASELTILGGMPARLFRISFSGELAYELAVPADYGIAAWEGVMAAGAEFGITPYGLEALGAMRIEKGHPAGPELDGRTTADDLGMGRMLSKAKDFIGKHLVDRPGLTDPMREKLVGLKPVDTASRVSAGAHLLPIGAEKVIANDQGWISSAAHSPVLGSWLGLGFVKNGRERMGEKLMATDPVRNREYEVEIVPAHFVDPKGERLHG
ncbi:MAG: sarcosine oxidase subunit alpha family protein [Hyphomicrobiaceae bacterium]